MPQLQDVWQGRAGTPQKLIVDLRNASAQMFQATYLQHFKTGCAVTPRRSGARGHRVTLRVQVPNNHILTQNLYYNYYYPNPKYLNIGYMDPLGYINWDPPAVGSWNLSLLPVLMAVVA